MSILETPRTIDALFRLCEYERDSRPGHVYFVQGVDGGPIKIGYTSGRSTREPAKLRLGQLQGSSPVLLKVLSVWPGDTELERELHGIFHADRLHGEWFTPSEDLLAVIDATTDAERLDDWYDESLDEIEADNARLDAAA